MTKFSKFIFSVCTAWIVYVGYSYISAFVSAERFEYYLDGDCPSLSIRVLPSELMYATVSTWEWVELIAWYDDKTDKEIFVTSDSARKYLAVMNCPRQKFSALVVRELAHQGKIQPVLRIKYGYMLAIMGLPVILFFLLVVWPISIFLKRNRIA